MLLKEIKTSHGSFYSQCVDVYTIIYVDHVLLNPDRVFSDWYFCGIGREIDSFINRNRNTYPRPDPSLKVNPGTYNNMLWYNINSKREKFGIFIYFGLLDNALLNDKKIIQVLVSHFITTTELSIHNIVAGKSIRYKTHLSDFRIPLLLCNTCSCLCAPAQVLDNDDFVDLPVYWDNNMCDSCYMHGL